MYLQNLRDAALKGAGRSSHRSEERQCGLLGQHEQVLRDAGSRQCIPDGHLAGVGEVRGNAHHHLEALLGIGDAEKLHKSVHHGAQEPCCDMRQDPMRRRLVSAAVHCAWVSEESVKSQ